MQTYLPRYLNSEAIAGFNEFDILSSKITVVTAVIICYRTVKNVIFVVMVV